MRPKLARKGSRDSGDMDSGDSILFSLGSQARSRAPPGAQANTLTGVLTRGRDQNGLNACKAAGAFRGISRRKTSRRRGLVRLDAR